MMLEEELEKKRENLAKEKVYYSQECVQESLRAYKIGWVTHTYVMCFLQILGAMPYLERGWPRF